MDIFKLVGSIYIDNEKANESISKTSKEAESLSDKFAKGVKNASKWALGIGASATAVGATLLKTAKSASDDLDKIQKGAQELGMSYETYQELDYALNRSGASIKDLSKGFKNITKDISDFQNGSEKASETYDKLGVSLKNTDGSMRTSEDVLKDSLIALSSMSDETERNILANDLLGNSYTNLIPFLNSGSEGVEELMNKAHDLGLVMSDEAVDAGADFGDMLTDVQDSFGKVIQVIGVKLFPLIEEVLQWVFDHMPEIQSFLNQFFDATTKMIDLLIKAIKFIAPVVEEVWNNFVKPILDGVIQFLDGVFTGDIDKAFSGIFNIVKTIFESLKAVFKAPLDWFLNILNGWVSKAVQPFKNLANSIGSIWESIKSKFKLPHFTLSGSLNPLNWISQGMPKIGVEWYAKGGIMENPTIFGMNGNNLMVGGERGAEAIAPLSDLETLYKNWSMTDKVIDKLNDLENRLADYLSDIASNSQKQIILDNGILVGSIAPDMNKQLNKINSLERRGIR